MVMTLKLMYSPILLRSIAQNRLLNHLGVRIWNREIQSKWEENFLAELDENYRVHSANYGRKVEEL